ncbi:decorin-like isoform X2 [Argopecten irradians]|uniref:decorin-like isoform X2 n=1 Tax=Argopecten irradians TaxID=31199 RepID=UPI00371F879B
MALNVIIYIHLLGLTVTGVYGCCDLRFDGDVTGAKCRECGLDAVPQDLPANVIKLDLSNNKIALLQTKSFTSMPNIQSLKLDSNGMKNISVGAFDGLVNLQYLSLRVTGVYGCFVVRFVGDVTGVTYRGCGLVAVPQDLPVNVTKLDLSNNDVTTL